MIPDLTYFQMIGDLYVPFDLIDSKRFPKSLIFLEGRVDKVLLKRAYIAMRLIQKKRYTLQIDDPITMSTYDFSTVDNKKLKLNPISEHAILISNKELTTSIARSLDSEMGDPIIQDDSVFITEILEYIIELKNIKENNELN